MSVADYNTDPNSNTSISGINIAEGCPPSGINNAIRQMMADIKTADDANVKLTGDQTIGGEKTFTSDANFLAQKFKFAFTHGTDPSAWTHRSINFTDDTGSVQIENLFGLIRSSVDVTGLTRIQMSAVQNVNASPAVSSINVYATKTGETYATAPSTSTSRTNGTDIVTRDFIPDDTRIVHTSGDQTIAGAKTFSGNVTVTKDFSMKNASFASRGTTPAATQWWSSAFTANNGNEVSGLWHNISTGNDSITEVRCYRNNATASTARFWAQVKSDGTKETGIDASIFRPAVSSYPSLGGSGAFRWSHVYATDTTITTSDERKKTAIADIPDAVLDAWGDVAWQQFQMRDAVAKKGENARIHNGLIAQRIDAVFKDHGLDASRYGLFCYDEWDATEAQCNEKGEILEPATEAGNEYSLRYEEALAMEAAYQRRRADRAEARLASIEERLAALEARI